MLVKNWMSKDVITVDENDSMNDATKRLKEHDIILQWKKQLRCFRKIEYPVHLLLMPTDSWLAP
jgi:hypothetical protein